MLVQRVIDPWNELTITYNNQPQTTTQNQVLTPPSTGHNQDFEITVIQLVQFMVSNPNINYGFGLKMQVESYYRSLVFGSSDRTDSTRRPKLIVDINTLEITSQPTDQFGNLGNMVQFNTDVNQTSALFQWQINNGNGFVDLNDTGQFIGSYTSTLYIQNINLDNHEQAFRCIIDYQNCHLISYPAFLYIKEVGIEDNQANTFSIFPNPTENFFTVKCNISAGERLLTSILNSTGQKIYSQNYNIDKDGELQIDASWLQSGIYFIQLNFGQSQITKKLIIH